MSNNFSTKTSHQIKKNVINTLENQIKIYFLKIFWGEAWLQITEYNKNIMLGMGY